MQRSATNFCITLPTPYHQRARRAARPLLPKTIRVDASVIGGGQKPMAGTRPVGLWPPPIFSSRVVVQRSAIHIAAAAAVGLE